MAKNKKIRTKIMLIFAAIVLLLAFLFMPVPYYLEMPGSAESISDYIKIDGKKDKQKGKYMLVYVSICQACSTALFILSSNALVLLLIVLVSCLLFSAQAEMPVSFYCCGAGGMLSPRRPACPHSHPAQPWRCCPARPDRTPEWEACCRGRGLQPCRP